MFKQFYSEFIPFKVVKLTSYKIYVPLFCEIYIYIYQIYIIALYIILYVYTWRGMNGINDLKPLNNANVHDDINSIGPFGLLIKLLNFQDIK